MPRPGWSGHSRGADTSEGADLAEDGHGRRSGRGSTAAGPVLATAGARPVAPAPARPFRGAVSDIDLRLLRVFRIVVEHGGFGPAEVVLDKSKSAISLDISGLEQRLGAKLCTRGRGGFALTEEGHAVYLAARQLFEDLAAFGDRVATATGQLAGAVTVFLVDNIVSVAAEPIASALGAFAARHPRVALTLESATPGGVEAAVLDGRADLGISVLPRTVGALDAVPLFEEELCLYAGRGHPLFTADGDAAPVAAEVVRGYALVRPSVTDDPDFAAMVEGFPLRASASNLDARVLLVLSGAFLGFLPPHYAGAWVTRGELAAVRPDLFSTRNLFQLVTRRTAPPSAAARALRGDLLTAFRGTGQPAPAPP